MSLETDSSYELTKADVCGLKKIYISAEFVSICFIYCNLFNCCQLNKLLLFNVF